MTLAPGAQVRVRNDWPEARGPCHIRTPHYLRGHTGTVVRRLGAFRNPEPRSIWPDAGGDEIVVELYESWLEAA